MKKRLISMLLSTSLILVFLCSSIVMSYAYSEELYAHYGPGGSNNSWASTRSDPSYMTATRAPVTPNKVSFYYKPSTLRSLPSSFVSSNDRKIRIYLMEKDTLSDDDYAMFYEGKFNGKYISSIQFHSTVSEDDLEVGKSVELFIKQYVEAIKGDKDSKYTSLFSYYCGID